MEIKNGKPEMPSECKAAAERAERSCENCGNDNNGYCLRAGGCCQYDPKELPFWQPKPAVPDTVHECANCANFGCPAYGNTESPTSIEFCWQPCIAKPAANCQGKLTVQQC
jgi:hypothetical protein